MDSSIVAPDTEAQANNLTATQPPANSQVQPAQNENQGDPSDEIWSMYLTEAEKQDTEVTESWKGDTDGILVFTGLFSATIATFIIESYKQLSPDSSDKTNALLTQISQQMVNMSNGAPLTIVVAESSQPFKPSASAIRVNVLWFLSIILSLTCALSATLMQQWARRYLELARRRGAFHRRGRMRSYIVDGVNRFGMARAIATMPAILHISVFLFFTGLVEFLFPIYATVAYTTLGCIVVFALAYASLTVLPNVCLACPYATPLSGFTWPITQFLAIVFLWTVLIIEVLVRKPSLKLWSLTDKLLHRGTRNPTNPSGHQHTEGEGLKTWREKLEDHIKMRGEWFWQGMRKSVEISAYGADSTVVTSALEWTLTALDEDKGIEDFAARVPGFFDSRAFPEATLAILPLMYHQPNTVPIFGPRLYDLLKTCMPNESILDEDLRKKRLRVCMNCMWSFAKAYNELGSSQAMPSYFTYTLASPRISIHLQTEEDPGVRVIARCLWALIVNKLIANFYSPSGPSVDDLAYYLPEILGLKFYDLLVLEHHPPAVILMNMLSLMFDDFGGLEINKVPSDALAVVKQTIDILSQTISSHANALEIDGVYLDQHRPIFNGSDGTFERIFLSRLIYFFKKSVKKTWYRGHDENMQTLQMCLKGLWHFVRVCHQSGSIMPLPRCVCMVLTESKISRRIHHRDISIRFNVIGRCVEALVVNKLAADIKSRNTGCGYEELSCLSVMLDSSRDHLMRLLSHPGAIEYTNMFFFSLNDYHSVYVDSIPSYMLSMVQQTFTAQSQALPPELNAWLRLNRITKLDRWEDSMEKYMSILHVWMKSLWNFTRDSVPLPSYICIAFGNPDMVRHIHQAHDAARMMGRCTAALVVNKLIHDAQPHAVPDSDAELACLSTILGTESPSVKLWLSQPGIMELMNFASLAFGDDSSLRVDLLPPNTRPVLQETLTILSRALPSQVHTELQLDQIVSLVDLSVDEFQPAIVSLFHNFLKMCRPGASSVIEEVRTRCLRMCMKTLWDCANAYIEITQLQLPSHFHLVLASPEITRHLHTEPDPVSRITGRCFEALIVTKLVSSLTSPISLSGGDRDPKLACISGILGTENCEVSLLRHQLDIIVFRNLVSAMSSGAHPLSTLLSTAVGMLPDVLNIAQDTLDKLAKNLNRPDFLPRDLPREQEELMQETRLGVANALRSNRFKNETEKTLDQLRQILEKSLQE